MSTGGGAKSARCWVIETNKNKKPLVFIPCYKGEAADVITEQDKKLKKD